MARTPNARRVTLQDIARETGYSINTVSHALRNKDDISRETSAMIRRVAQEMGYMGNQIASSMRSGRTDTLAVILGNMSNPFYGIMTDTIQDAATAFGYSLLIMCSREQAELEMKQVEAAVSRRVDGVLLFPTDDSLQTIQRLNALRVPLVLMARTLGEGIVDSVISDEENGAHMIVQHLIEHGRRRLGFLARQRIVFSYGQRLQGFVRACDEAGIPAGDRFVYVQRDDDAPPRGAFDAQANLQACLRRWRAAGVDGLFVFCDEEAWHVQACIHDTPELHGWDVGIVGFDNIHEAQHFPAGLCSVDCDFGEMARQGIELLRARIQDGDLPPRQVVCPVRLVCRGTH